MISEMQFFTTARGYVRACETEEFSRLCGSLWASLNPEGALEELFAMEIVGAAWRLRRCRRVEEDLAGAAALDPMQDPETGDTQRSVDLARAQSNLIVRRSLAELRRLQAERAAPGRQAPEPKSEPEPAAAEASADLEFDALMALADQELARRYRESGLGAFAAGAGFQSAPLPPEVSFCKTVAPPPAARPAPGRMTGRNQPCPCKSGLKYKRCCGNPAASGQNRAA